MAALGLRGSPGAGAPASGWRFEDLYEDLRFLISRTGFARFVLSAYSANVPLAVACAARRPDRVRGLVLIDHPPRPPDPGREWARRVREKFPHLPEATVQGILAEFGPFDAQALLREVRAPVLVMRGEPERGGRLGAEEAAAMRAALADVREVRFPESGHAVWEPDPRAYLNALAGFVAEVEAGLNPA